MMKSVTYLSISILTALFSCQSSPKADAQLPNSAQTTPPAAGAPTADEARAAVGRYLLNQPNATLFVLDSARVNDNQTSWQVLVPRTDWAQRMPNRARFEVDKATGTVRTASAK